MARDAFGYEPREDVVKVTSMSVAEGKSPGTLMPVVVLNIGWDTGEPDGKGRAGFAMSPDEADALAGGIADELHRWAARAREKHWEG